LLAKLHKQHRKDLYLLSDFVFILPDTHECNSFTCKP